MNQYYTSYGYLYTQKLDEFNAYQQYSNDKRFKCVINETAQIKTARITRDLGFFEAIGVFFELLRASLHSCLFRLDAKSHPHLKNAWEALKSFKWVQTFEFEEIQPQKNISHLELSNKERPDQTQKRASLASITTLPRLIPLSQKKKDLEPNNENLSPISKSHSRTEAGPLATPIKKKRVTTPIKSSEEVSISLDSEETLTFILELETIIKAEENPQQLVRRKSKKFDEFSDSLSKFSKSLSERQLKFNGRYRKTFIENCLNYIIDSKIDLKDQTIYEMIDQIIENPLELKAFVENLSIDQKNSHLRSLLKRERQHLEGATPKNKRIKRLTAIFPLLSDEQFTWMIKQGEFIQMCKIIDCRKAITQSFSAKRLGELASSGWIASYRYDDINTLQESLQDIIKGLPGDDFLLGKLVAILPHVTTQCKTELIGQIAHLPLKSRPGYPFDPNKIDNSMHVKFVKKLESLALLYCQENDVKIKNLIANEQNDRAQGATRQPTKELKKWRVDLSHLEIKMNDEAIPTRSFTDEELKVLITDLENTLSTTSLDDALQDRMNSLDESSLESFLRLSSHQALEKLWLLESRKTLISNASSEARTRRLACLFNLISEDSLKIEMLTIGFQKTVSVNAKVAAEVFTIPQLLVLAENWKVHQFFVPIIVNLDKDKFRELAPSLIPLSSYFLRSALAKRIELLFPKTKKTLLDQLNNACSKLNQEIPELETTWASFSLKNPNW